MRTLFTIAILLGLAAPAAAQTADRLYVTSDIDFSRSSLALFRGDASRAPNGRPAPSR